MPVCARWKRTRERERKSPARAKASIHFRCKCTSYSATGIAGIAYSFVRSRRDPLCPREREDVIKTSRNGKRRGLSSSLSPLSPPHFSRPSPSRRGAPSRDWTSDRRRERERDVAVAEEIFEDRNIDRDTGWCARERIARYHRSVVELAPVATG